MSKSCQKKECRLGKEGFYSVAVTVLNFFQCVLLPVVWLLIALKIICNAFNPQKNCVVKFPHSSEFTQWTLTVGHLIGIAPSKWM